MEPGLAPRPVCTESPSSCPTYLVSLVAYVYAALSFHMRLFICVLSFQLQSWRIQEGLPKTQYFEQDHEKGEFKQSMTRGTQ